MESAPVNSSHEGPELAWIYSWSLASYEDGPELTFEVTKIVKEEVKKKKKRCRGYKKLRSRIQHKFCLVCGLTDKLTVDHIVPRVKGGAVKAKENLMFLCEKCNSNKSDKMPADWLRTITPKTVKKFCPARFEILVQAIDNAIQFHCQIMTNFPIS